MAVITLTTDFGTQDWFVGTMKGVLLKLTPRSTLVDITHDIPPGDIWGAAFVLASAFRYFPPGAIHLVVVDPGVGGPRAALAVQTVDHSFVGPDNGVLSLAVGPSDPQAIHRIENTKYLLRQPSQTFHGRDIFAPVAAHLSRGLPIAKVGPRATTFQRLSWPAAKVAPRIEGRVVYIDRFGNAITNLPNHVASSGLARLRAQGPPARSIPVRPNYQSVPKGRAVAVPGSTGYIEIALNGGHAALRLGLRVGSRISAPRGRRLFYGNRTR